MPWPSPASFQSAVPGCAFSAMTHRAFAPPTVPVPLPTRALPALAQESLLKDHTDQDLQTFVSIALVHTLEAMYGNPEYGGNKNLVGWKTTHWPGDTQPRGFTPAQVSTPESTTLGMSQSQAQDALKRFAPAFAGEAASTAAFWRGRPDRKSV